MKIDTIELLDYKEWLAGVPDNSIDQINIDPPYGVTKAPWDKQPDWVFLREQFNRTLKRSGSLFLWGVQPMLSEIYPIFTEVFTFRFEFIWNKLKNSHLDGNLPIRIHENLWWYVKKGVEVSEIYCDIDAIKEMGEFYKSTSGKNPLMPDVGKRAVSMYTKRFPKSVITEKKPRVAAKDKHPTQKPDRLIKMCIKYTCPRDGLVLDCFAGSGRFAVIAKNNHRHFCGCETNLEYYKLSQRNLAETMNDITAWARKG